MSRAAKVMALVVIAGAFVLVNLDNSEAADGTPKMMTFVIEGNFRVHYDCTFMDKTKKTDKEEQVQKIEFHPEYIVLFGQTHNGRVIPVHAIKELTWEQS